MRSRLVAAVLCLAAGLLVSQASAAQCRNRGDPAYIPIANIPTSSDDPRFAQEQKVLVRGVVADVAQYALGNTGFMLTSAEGVNPDGFTGDYFSLWVTDGYSELADAPCVAVALGDEVEVEGYVESFGYDELEDDLPISLLLAARVSVCTRGPETADAAVAALPAVMASEEKAGTATATATAHRRRLSRRLLQPATPPPDERADYCRVRDCEAEPEVPVCGGDRGYYRNECSATCLGHTSVACRVPLDTDCAALDLTLCAQAWDITDSTTASASASG
ncbi:hypothetical protein HYH03_014841 [Edaphochlamys debaryana]|uniref:Kazal-like domain-containing protein n=1 Tax=Edaphochlamys debaryana TaxID=47281 RepID=A0A835XN68_9CHLO|nr:hypothetical protein HYH03_014841 [Edaphochlamys debaryana]|eukprot:KAG2486540.1 hypothetical protein HYH03_014841 [Edaphochlamys debaryana]